MDELREFGSMAACVRVKQSNSGASLNLQFGLERSGDHSMKTGILIVTHLAALALGFAAGIYALPIRPRLGAR